MFDQIFTSIYLSVFANQDLFIEFLEMTRWDIFNWKDLKFPNLKPDVMNLWMINKFFFFFFSKTS